MTRASLTVAFSAALFAIGPFSAAAQQSFEPPLDAPAPLAAPVSFELTPGSRSVCVDSQSVEGVPLPAPPEARYELVIEDAGGGVRVRLVDRDATGLEISIVMADDGAITLEESSALGGVSAEEKALIAAVVTQLPELRLHQRTLSQGDSMYELAELEQIFGDMFAAMGGQTARPEISGGSFLTGESDAGGRRVAVFGGTIEVSAPGDGLTITQDVQEAYDVETGLRVYSNITARMPAPPGVDATEIVFRQTTVCALGEG